MMHTDTRSIIILLFKMLLQFVHKKGVFAISATKKRNWSLRIQLKTVCRQNCHFIKVAFFAIVNCYCCVPFNWFSEWAMNGELPVYRIDKSEKTEDTKPLFQVGMHLYLFSLSVSLSISACIVKNRMTIETFYKTSFDRM